MALDINFAEILIQRELDDLQRRRKELRYENGIFFYVPHAKQNLFHCASEYLNRYVRTGNRFGKTTMGLAEDIAWARGERVWYPKGDPRRTLGIPAHSTKGVIFVADWDKVESLFTSQDSGASRGALFKLLPESWIADVQKNRQGNIFKVLIKSIHGGTSSIQFETVKSFKQDPSAHESEWWDYIHVDEPCPEEMFIAYARGLIDRGGKAWFCCTPVTEFWIDDYFIPRGQMRGAFNTGENLIKDRWIMTGSTYDNPNLTRENIQVFEESLKPSERETRIDGRPRALSGAIYKEFNPDKHLIYGTPPGWFDPITPPLDHSIKIMIDPHPMTPHAVLFGACSPGGYHTFYHEIFVHCLIKDLCALILAVPGVERAKILCDPIAFNECSTGDGTMMIDDFRECGIYAYEAVKELNRGILSTQAALSATCRAGNPVLRFSETLWTTRMEFERFVWDQKRPTPNPTCPDHMMENLYRYVLDGLEYIDPTRSTHKMVPSTAIVKPDYKLPDVKVVKHTDYGGVYPMVPRGQTIKTMANFVPIARHPDEHLWSGGILPTSWHP